MNSKRRNTSSGSLKMWTRVDIWGFESQCFSHFFFFHKNNMKVRLNDFSCAKKTIAYLCCGMREIDEESQVSTINRLKNAFSWVSNLINKCRWPLGTTEWGLTLGVWTYENEFTQIRVLVRGRSTRFKLLKKINCSRLVAMCHEDIDLVCVGRCLLLGIRLGQQ